MEYSNPQTTMSFDDWPYGNKRTGCVFTIQHSKGMERAIRITVNPKTGRPNKPKTTTYTVRTMFVTGDNGRLYIVKDIGWAFFIMKSDMTHTEESIYPTPDATAYNKIAKLFNELDDNVRSVREA